MNRVFDIWTKPPTDHCKEWAVGIGQYLRFTITSEAHLDEVRAVCAQQANLLLEKEDSRDVAHYGEDGKLYPVPVATVKADLLMHVVEQGSGINRRIAAMTRLCRDCAQAIKHENVAWHCARFIDPVYGNPVPCAGLRGSSPGGAVVSADPRITGEAQYCDLGEFWEPADSAATTTGDQA